MTPPLNKKNDGGHMKIVDPRWVVSTTVIIIMIIFGV